MDANINVNAPSATDAPWTFKAVATFGSEKVADKDILSCAVYKRVTETLTKKLFESEQILKNALRGGLSVRFEEMSLEHFDLEGKFDKAVCTLTLSNRGPARFSLETQFFLNHSVITVATREGILYFEELN
jgi:hypothetical protein